MENFWNIIIDWTESIKIVNMLATILIGAIIYKLAPVLAKYIVTVIAHARGSHRPRNSERRKRLETVASMCSTVIKSIVVLTVIFTILSDLNINLVPLFASAGVAGVALGFGAQNIIKDLLAGFFVILENQYRVGDAIDVSGLGIGNGSMTNGGIVEKITLRSTVLRDRLGNKHFIPNGAIVQVTNKTMEFSKVHFILSVASDTNMDTLIKIINDLGIEMNGEDKWKHKIIVPPHFSEVGQIGANGFNVTINGKTEPATQWDVTSEYRKRLISKLQSHKINTIEEI